MPHARTILYALYFYLIASFNNRFWRPFLHGLLKLLSISWKQHPCILLRGSLRVEKNWIVTSTCTCIMDKNSCIEQKQIERREARLTSQKKKKKVFGYAFVYLCKKKKKICVCVGGGGDYTLPPRFRHLCQMIPMSTGRLDINIFPSSSTFSKQTSLMVIIN